MDQGAWDYQLRLIPHNTALPKKRLFEEADFLHMPVEYLQDSCHTGNKWLAADSLLAFEKENVAVSCVKQSLEYPEELVVRAFETEGKEGSLGISHKNKKIRIDFTPYEIKTLRLTKKGFVVCDMLERTQKEG